MSSVGSSSSSSHDNLRFLEVVVSFSNVDVANGNVETFLGLTANHDEWLHKDLCYKKKETDTTCPSGQKDDGTSDLKCTSLASNRKQSNKITTSPASNNEDREPVMNVKPMKPIRGKSIMSSPVKKKPKEGEHYTKLEQEKPIIDKQVSPESAGGKMLRSIMYPSEFREFEKHISIEGKKLGITFDYTSREYKSWGD